MSEAASLSMQVLSAISAASALLMIAVMEGMPPSSKKKTYFQMLRLIAISNFLTSIGSAMGYCAIRTPECFIQGLLTNIFTLSSIFWTTVLTASLFSIVYLEKPLTITLGQHIICWLLPTFVSFIPLVNTTYGPVGNWCWVSETKNTPSWGIPVWFWISYYAWVWLCVLTMVGLLISVSRNKFHSSKSKEAMMAIVNKIYLYPIIVVVC
jgi:hypothetical protein